MNLQCEDGFLFHLWGSTGNCLRCGVTAGIDLDFDFDHLDQGMLDDERSVDVQSAPEMLSRVRPVDHRSLCEDDLPQSAAAASSAAASAASNPEGSDPDLSHRIHLPAFLRRRHQ